ncbi:MAG: hypothetical protein IT427_07815 [Pirellulales bacterium]|nr:hypothetical protein [Pirellulales bacterium]
MEVTRSWIALAVLASLFATGGASCRQYVRQYTEPRTLPETATLEQIAEKVNGNTALILSAQSTRATLKADGVPPMGANLAIMPQRRMHLQGTFVGPRIDMGSNDESFWIWIKDNPQPAVFVCRHDQFARSNARQMIPIEPERLIEALGLAHIDPRLALGPPQVVGANRIEIDSRQPSELGELKKKTIVDGWNGLVLEQHIYDSLGMLLASSFTSRYKHDPTTGAALPRTIEIQWPTAKMSFKLEVSDWVINQIPSDNTALWAVPHPADYPVVDLADPNIQFVAPGAPAASSPATPPTISTRALHPPVEPMPNGPQSDLPPLPPDEVYPTASSRREPANPLR